MSVTTIEGIVKNGQIVLPEGAILPESAKVYIQIADNEARTPRIWSARLKNPSDATLLIKTVEDDIEESI